MIVAIHPSAADEIEAAARLGEERSLGLGSALVIELRRVAALLSEFPDLGQLLDDRHRRFPLRRFPFGVIFRVDGDTLTIVALAHRRQQPGYWVHRR